MNKSIQFQVEGTKVNIEESTTSQEYLPQILEAIRTRKRFLRIPEDDVVAICEQLPIRHVDALNNSIDFTKTWIWVMIDNQLKLILCRDVFEGVEIVGDDKIGGQVPRSHSVLFKISDRPKSDIVIDITPRSVDSK